MVLSGAGSPGPPGGVSVLVRIWLPDRPGALGAVASRIGAVRGDILGIDVLERSNGLAIDEFGVILPSPDVLPLLVREVEEVDGARVEEAVIVEHFPDPRLDALAAAVLLCEAGSPPALCTTLVTYVGRALMADWVAVVDGDRVLEGWGVVPSERYVAALAGGLLHSDPVSDGHSGPEDLATAVLPGLGVALLVGRAGNTFRARERAQLSALARVAGRLWAILDDLERAQLEAAAPG